MSSGRRLPLALLGLTLTVGPLRAQAPEPVLVELGLGRLAKRTVEAYRIGQTALLPVHQFFDLAEVRVDSRSDGAIVALIQPGNLPFVIDTVSRSWKLGKDRHPLAADQLLTAGSEQYLATSVLGEAFDLEWAVSWADLQVVVVEPNRLPIARRIRREASLRGRLAASQLPDQTVSREIALERPTLSGLVLDYSFLSPSDGPLSSATYSTALGLDLFGGSFTAAVQSQGADRPARADIAWAGIWRNNHALAQLRLGDGFATGPRTRTLRGVSLTNSPYARPAWVGMVPFSGELGPGWSIEAWRGGRMIGFDSVNALGQFSFDVPIQYGENPVDFVAYGPFGEVREFNRTYRARPDVVPLHRLEYGLSGGACRDACTATGNLDLRYGLATRWSVRTGIDRFWRDTLPDLSHPYVGLAGSIGNAWMVEAEAVRDATLRGAVRYEPTRQVQLGAEVHRFARGVTAPLLTPAGRLSQWTLTAFAQPFGGWGGTYVEASLDRIAAVSGDLTSTRVGVSLQRGGIRLIPSMRYQADRPASGLSQDHLFYGLNTIILPRPSLGPVLGRILLRTSFEVEDGQGASLASAHASIPVLSGLRLESGISWVRGQRGPGLSFLLAAELPSVRSYTSLQAGAGRPATGAQFVQGSVIYNRTNSLVELSHGPSVERAGVSGRVFLDQNSNGRFDPGETPIAGVRMTVGHDYAVSDSSGFYRVWDVLPFQPTRVAVDSTSLPSPLWVPAFWAASLEPSPNRYRELDIPVEPGGVVEGRVVRRGLEETPVPGVTLLFRHDGTGELRQVMTFSDGTFYAIGFRPGTWIVAVDPKTLELLGLTDIPVRFTVAADPDGASVEGVEVLLQ